MGNAIRIADMNPAGEMLAFDLAQLLAVLDPGADDLVWVLVGVETIWVDAGPGGLSAAAAAAIEDASVQPGGTTITTPTLRRLAHATSQTLEGRFVGYPARGRQAELSIQAVRSSYWIVWSRHPAALDKLRQAFDDVAAYDEPAPSSRSSRSFRRR